MSSGGGGSQTVVQKTDPPAYMVPYLKDIASHAQKAYGQVSQDPYGNPIYAGPNALQQGALQQTAYLAANAPDIGGAYQNAAQYGANSLNSGFLSNLAAREFNPTNISTSGAIEAAIDPMRQELLRQTIPGIKSQAVASGAYGGTGQDFLEAQALNDFNRNAINTAANIQYQDLARQDQLRAQDLQAQRDSAAKLSFAEQQLMQLYPQLVQQGFQAGLQPAQIMGQVGAQQQQWDQASLDALLQQYYMNQQAPFQGLPEYAQLIFGSPAGGTSSSTSKGGSSTFGNVIQGGLGGAMLGSQLLPWLFPSTFAAGGMGAGLLGGGLGALFALSDERLKENIQAIGILPNGITLVEFNYKTLPFRMIGVIAQDVERIMPDAVKEVEGFKAVDYSRII